MTCQHSNTTSVDEGIIMLRCADCGAGKTSDGRWFETKRDEVMELAHQYKKVLNDFLEGGVDELFNFINKNEFLHNNGTAKAMLRCALRAQVDDATAYRNIVRLASDAGVPLFNPLPLP